MIIGGIEYKYKVLILHETPAQRWVTEHGAKDEKGAFDVIKHQYKISGDIKSYEIHDDNGIAPIELAKPND